MRYRYTHTAWAGTPRVTDFKDRVFDDLLGHSSAASSSFCTCSLCLVYSFIGRSPHTPTLQLAFLFCLQLIGHLLFLLFFKGCWGTFASSEFYSAKDVSFCSVRGFRPFVLLQGPVHTHELCFSWFAFLKNQWFMNFDQEACLFGLFALLGLRYHS